MEYAGFWRRFGAYWLDLLIMSPLFIVSTWGNNSFRLFQLYYFIPGLLFGLWFHVYLVKRYGATPGKLLLKIKISKIDGTDVGYKEAFLRYSVLFIFGIFLAYSLIPVVVNMSDELYFSMTYRERLHYTMQNVPSWRSYVEILMQIWIWSEFIVMLTNKKKRALHDYIASTIVVKNDKSKVEHESFNNSLEINA